MDDELRRRLRESFRWIGDRTDDGFRADVTGWWRDPVVLRRIGPALAALTDGPPTVVMGPQSRGGLLGALVAVHLRIGLLEVRKDPGPAADSDRWTIVTSPPDSRDRHRTLGVRSLLRRREL